MGHVFQLSTVMDGGFFWVSFWNFFVLVGFYLIVAIVSVSEFMFLLS